MLNLFSSFFYFLFEYTNRAPNQEVYGTKDLENYKKVQLNIQIKTKNHTHIIVLKVEEKI
jgi:hypothetical protein